MQDPFDPERLNALWARMEGDAIERLERQGIERAESELTRELDMRYSLQVNEVRVDAPSGIYDERDAASLIERFEAVYQRIYGRDSGYADAGFAITGLRVLGRGPSRTIPVNPERGDGAEPQPSGSRLVRFHDRGGAAEEIPTYDQTAARPGARFAGPAIVELPDTTVCVHAGHPAGGRRGQPPPRGVSDASGRDA